MGRLACRPTDNWPGPFFRPDLLFAHRPLRQTTFKARLFAYRRIRSLQLAPKTLLEGTFVRSQDGWFCRYGTLVKISWHKKCCMITSSSFTQTTSNQNKGNGKNELECVTEATNLTVLLRQIMTGCHFLGINYNPRVLFLHTTGIRPSLPRRFIPGDRPRNIDPLVASPRHALRLGNK